MKATVVMALGASLFVFGILWLLFSSAMVYELLPMERSFDLIGQIEFALQMSGILVATIGAGMLTYGHVTRAENAKQATPSQ